MGKTRDAGWQIGHARTVRASLEEVWDLLTSEAGLAIWLGDGIASLHEKGQAYETQDGAVGEVRSLRPHDRIRVTWQLPQRPDAVTLQIAVTPARTGTTIRLHAEKLYDADERESMRRRLVAVADGLEQLVAEIDGG